VNFTLLWLLATSKLHHVISSWSVVRSRQRARRSCWPEQRQRQFWKIRETRMWRHVRQTQGWSQMVRLWWLGCFVCFYFVVVFFSSVYFIRYAHSYGRKWCEKRRRVLALSAALALWGTKQKWSTNVVHFLVTKAWTCSRVKRDFSDARQQLWPDTTSDW